MQMSTDANLLILRFMKVQLTQCRYKPFEIFKPFLTQKDARQARLQNLSYDPFLFEALTVDVQQRCSTRNHRVLGVFPSSGKIENRKNDVSETGSVSALR
jgi:hypothetical protein